MVKSTRVHLLIALAILCSSSISVSSPCDDERLSLLGEKDTSALIQEERDLLQELEQQCIEYTRMSEREKSMYDYTEKRIQQSGRKARTARILGFIIPGLLAIGAISFILRNYHDE